MGDNVCLKCGRAIEDADREYCEKCAGLSFSFRRCYIVFPYEGELRMLLMKFKYLSRKDLGIFFAREAVKRYGDELGRLSFDAVIPVPIHESRFRERGYNQAETVSAYIAQALGISCFPEILVRTRHTIAQKKLDTVGRLANLRTAFAIDWRGLNLAKKEMARHGKSEIKRALLVDDIFTTGSTLECASEKLIKAGIEEVYALCISGTREI